MQVETYEIEELACETTEQCEEALVIAERYGLEGQKRKAEQVESPTNRLPYRPMTLAERNVWRLLCPRHVNVSTYSDMPIPLRVLQVIAYVRDANWFAQLEVWTAEGVEKDPLLVGHHGTYDGPRYLLARWADELDEWPAVVKKARELFSRHLRETLLTIQRKVEIRLACAEDEAALSFPEKASLPSYYD